MSLLPEVIPRFAWLALAPEFTVIPVPLVMETVDPEPVSRMPQLPGPAVPRPKVSAKAELPQIIRRIATAVSRRLIAQKPGSRACVKSEIPSLTFKISSDRGG